VLLLTYKSLHGLVPGYLHDLLLAYAPDHSLRSNEQGLLSVARTKLVTYGDCAWAKATTLLWNGLPVRHSKNVDVVKAKLKTKMFIIKCK
jgi:hypothetical protein